MESPRRGSNPQPSDLSERDICYPPVTTPYGAVAKATSNKFLVQRPPSEKNQGRAGAFFFIFEKNFIS